MPNYKNRILLFIISAGLFFAFADSEQEKQLNSTRKMPNAVTPVAKPQAATSLYIPGKTNITIIPGHRENSVEEDEGQTDSPVKGVSDTKNITKQIPSSADFLKLKAAGLLSNLRSILSENGPKLNSLIAELENAKANSADNTVNHSEILFADASADVSILRFLVNGQDIQSSCHNLYFSGIESNGAFLLTGDFSNNLSSKPYSETFYFLFSAKGTNGGRTVYKVTSSVSQRLINSESPLFMISQLEDLNAYKTGGFVSIHDEKENVSIDFLLSMNNPKVSIN